MPETKITDVRVPLPWEQAVAHRDAAKNKAARQFLAIWQEHKGRQDSELLWGEEVEYFLVDVGGESARVALCADEVLRRLGTASAPADGSAVGSGWRTEYGNMMVEGVTEPPFAWAIDEILRLEPALAWRRREVERVAREVGESVRVVTLAAFPLLGVPGCTAPPAEPAPTGEVSQSVLCPDEATSPHPRYQTFTANYRKRKSCKVGAFIPRDGIAEGQRLGPDEVAKLPFDLARRGSQERDPVPGHIYLDSQAFGACQCCMQATFLARNIEEARYLTDQFLVLAPLFLALTAATPFLRGLVAETDTRWPAFQQSWDDRCEEELGRVRNSRTSPCDLFIGEGLAKDAAAEGAANDVEVPVHAPAMGLLTEAGVDPLLSRHVAHTLVRDPLVIFEDRLDIDDAKDADHWDQLLGTNWGNVRFKPPPRVDSGIGWRVEFRSPDVQLTDFENAAVVAVVRLLAEVMVEEKWDLVIPVSLSDQNDAASAERCAASRGRFWFRESVLGGGAVQQRSLQDIFSGEGGVFPRCRAWLARRREVGACSAEAVERLGSYMRLFERRAEGSLPTPASFLRERLRRHPAYQGDGELPIAFVHDLCKFASAVNAPGHPWPEELLGPPPGASG